VVASLDALTELLKQCKTGITDIGGHPQLIAGRPVNHLYYPTTLGVFFFKENP
jgi:hypothetical protein